MENLHFLFLMIFLHICDDYYLQGWLASAKQKSWWEQNAPQGMYKYDYLVALFMHSFSWTFMVMLPCLFYLNFNIDINVFAIFFFNLCTHFIVDNEKANNKTINLVQDQFVHLMQIIFTYVLIFY